MMKNLLDSLYKNIRQLESQFGRAPNSVKLLAVSKKHSVERIEEAYKHGQMAFGESYLQEALPKIYALADKSIEWHFIGPIQKNKTKGISESFSWVHSVDRAIIAQRLNEQRPAHLEPLNICIQVNISQENTKSGANVEEVFDLGQIIQTLPRLRLRGLMAIPEFSQDSNQQRAIFRELKKLFDKLNQQGYNLDTLSIGMSDDYPAAIAEGATIIRIGSRIFGQRF
jgi:pyridoxal phosphate enzyme (YggS family)